MTDAGEAPQTQFERTVLAWRRTLILVMVVAGIGGIRLLIDQRHHAYLGIFAGLVGLAATVPILHRKRQLRRHDTSPATWQPAALTLAIVVLAVGLALAS